MAARFQEPELSRLGPNLRLAEELTGSFFKIPAFDSARYPFELATAESLDDREIVPVAFAQISRYEVPNERLPGRGVRRPLYRICLQDHNVLAALERERGEVALDPLLLYILTHELCHIVRFCNFHQLFEADEVRRDREETLVHQITYDILAPMRDRGVHRVLARYAGERQLL
jgi:hypothetical protein